MSRSVNFTRASDQGAYLIYLLLTHAVSLSIGSLGHVVLPAGKYVYVGSARRGIDARLARHKRLADTKSGKPHWHIDYLLLNPCVEWIGGKSFSACQECSLSRRVAALKEASVPVAKFGATDCRSGCRAHLYRLAGISHPLFRRSPERN